MKIKVPHMRSAYPDFETACGCEFGRQPLEEAAQEIYDLRQTVAALCDLIVHHTDVPAQAVADILIGNRSEVEE